MTGKDGSGTVQIKQSEFTGTCCQVEVFVDSKEVMLLLDSGSNMTLMPEGCFKRSLGEKEPGDENNWLKLKAIFVLFCSQSTGCINLKNMKIMISKDHPNALSILGLSIIFPYWDILFSKSQI